MKEDFYQIILGNFTPGMFLGYIAIMFIGAAISLLMDVSKRDKTSRRSPNRFSWWFLLKDNIKRFFLVILIMYVFIRFSDMLFEGQPLDWVLLIMGYNFDNLISKAREKFETLKG